MLFGIDGPAGSGKSTMAKTVAPEFGAVVLEGGAWYRALTYLALQRKVSPDDEAALLEVAQDLELKFVPEQSTGEYRLYLNGDDVTDELYREDVSGVIGSFAQVLPVREVVDGKMLEAIKQYDSIIFVGRHLQRFIPGAAILTLVIDTDEAERRHAARMGGEAQKVADRNVTDKATASKLGIKILPGEAVDVTDMSPQEQADLLRNFIRQTLLVAR